jgi:hypothetical protein
MPKTDPALKAELAAKADTGGEVQAVIKLKPDTPEQIVPTAERTCEIAEKLVARVAKKFGREASHFNVFKNFGSFVVASDAAFIRELIGQPEVAAVMANQQQQSAFIEPIVPAQPARKRTTKKAGSRRMQSSATPARKLKTKKASANRSKS